MEYNLFEALELSMVSLFSDIMSFLPQLFIAIIVVVIGWIVGGMFGGVVRRLLVRLRLDDALDKAGVDELSRKAGYTFHPSKLVGDLVKWFVVLAFVIVALDILNLDEVTIFMRTEVLSYLPVVFSAVLILFAGVIVAGFAKTATMGIVRSGSSHSPEFFGKLTYYMVLAFTLMAVLNQLSVADELIETLFMGIVFALSLGAGLAFGLGGKEAAGKYINKVTGGSSHHS